jgi:polyhydroxybutyrate depolymerase
MRSVWLVGSVLLLSACGDAGSSGEAGAGASGAGDSGGSDGSGASPSSSGGAGGSANGGAPGSGGGGSGPSCVGLVSAAGTTTQTLEVNGANRSYVLAIPVTLDGSTAVPLIFGFHGFGGTGEAASQYFNLTGNEAAVYAYPQALPLPDQNGGIGWDMTVDGVDVAFIDALVAKLSAEHCIDPARVFAAGHSHGASFSNHLGCYRPELFRAIAPVAGGGPWAGECTGSVSAMLVHGSADSDVPIENGLNSREHWLEANGCAAAPSAPSDPSPCVSYEGCSEPVMWCEHSGGHEWPRFAGAGIRSFFLGL